MIDVDAMQERIRMVNPVPDLEQLDPDGLTRLVGLAAHPSFEVSEDEPLQRQTGRRRGPVVAIATAAIALGAVALAVVVAVSLGSVGTQGDIAPAATGETTTSWQVPNPALYTKRLVPHPSASPPPLSTVIGDLEFELLQFESPAYKLWHVYWTEPGLVSIANGRLYWSADFYNWESTGPVDGDMITVVDNDVIVHGRGAAVRYSWDGGAWVEGDILFTSGANQIVFGPRGAVAFGGGTFLYSTDGVTFNTAAQAPLSTPERGRCPEGGGWFASEPLLLATDEGYVALVPTLSAWWSEDAVCESVVWVSTDGNVWDLASAESPFGEESVVSHVAERGGRFVAAGADSLAPSVIWFSGDGIAWSRLDSDLDVIDGLFAGELGWVIIGAEANYEGQVIMFSADGIAWDGPYERPEALRTGYLPPQIAVGDDVIFGISGGHPDVLIVRTKD